MKRGAIWISAVLYVAVGVIVLSLLLSALLPLIEKIKDRNTFIQTKELFFTLDKTITTTAQEGPGSQRSLTPLTIAKGMLIVNDSTDTLIWEMKTRADVLSPGAMIQEGPLNLTAIASPVQGEYTLRILLSYAGIYNVSVQSSVPQPYQGKYTLVVRHTGTFTPTNQPGIALIFS